MATTVKDLGMVTAYAYAVSKGYTGTEQEFAELMASYATVAEAAEAAAAAAAASATDAAGSASTATTKANNAAASANDAAGSATTASAKADEASASATSAAGNASVASTKAGEAASSATAAAGSATTAGTKATEAAGSATDAATAKTAAQAAQTAAETAQGKAEDAQEAAEAAAEQAEETLNSYAKVDGSYSSMTVGNAEQLVATVGVEDSVPYNFRTSGGTADIGDREVDKIVGGTVAWNQLATTKSMTNSEADTRTFLALRFGNNNLGNIYDTGRREFVISAVSTSVNNIRHNGETKNIVFTPVSGIIANHIYLVSLTLAGVDVQTVGGVSADNIMAFDLTQMFGTTIADYIYSLEQATAGAGVAWFRKLFPKPYYAYNPGELMSVQAAAHKMVGFNQLPESPVYLDNSTTLDKTKATQVVPGQQYQFTFDGIGTATSWRIGVKMWDMNGNIISGTQSSTDGRPFTPSAGGAYWNNNSKSWYDGTDVTGKARTYTFDQPGYVRFYFGGGSTSSSMEMQDACLHLSWDGERDGEYAPYEAHTYPLDDSLTLRGIPKLDSGNGLYYDGDTYESDGTVTRRYSYLEFDGSSDENWNLQSINSAGIANFGISIPFYDTALVNNSISNRFSRQTTLISNTTTEGYMLAGNATLYIRIDSTKADTVAALRTWLASNPTAFVYVLATPTTETADPFQSPQIVDDFGTEEYVDAAVAAETRDVAIPVGHETLYQANLRAKLEMAPDSPDGDGDYIVRQTNGQNAYVPLVIPQELPANPTTDGTYHLKATVSGSSVTLTWEADT